MPKNNKPAVPSSAFERLSVGGRSNSSSSSGRTMPTTTRSMSRRLVSTSQAPRSQGQAGPSRAGAQQRSTQQALPAGDDDNDDESDDEDEEDDEEDEDEDDEDEDDEDEEDDDEDESSDEEAEESPADSIFRLFASPGPSGRLPGEPLPNAASQQYHAIAVGVANQSSDGAEFCRNLRAAAPSMPGDVWSDLVYRQLRLNWELTMARFDRYQEDPVHGADVIDTTVHLRSLVRAIEYMVRPENWASMQPLTKSQYFGLVLDLIRGVMRRNYDQTSAAQRSHVGTQPSDVNLYRRMIAEAEDAIAARVLQDMGTRGGMNGSERRRAEQANQIREIIEVLSRHWPRGVDNTPTNSPAPPMEWLTRMQGLYTHLAARAQGGAR